MWRGSRSGHGDGGGSTRGYGGSVMGPAERKVPPAPMSNSVGRGEAAASGDATLIELMSALKFEGHWAEVAADD